MDQVGLEAGAVVVLGSVAVARPQLRALLLTLQNVDAVVAEEGALHAVDEFHAVALVIFQRHQTGAVSSADPLGQRA